MTQNAYKVLKERGFVSQVTDEPALEKLFDSGPQAAYIGFDPTADSLHAGSLLPLMALYHLRRCGHRPIAILGGGTAMVGDPSGKTEMRPLLEKRRIEQNAKRLEEQIRRFVGPEGLVVNNAEWLLGLNYIEFLRDIGRHFSVNRMLTFESYKIRLEKGLSFLEFNYQLLQAYDFWQLFKRHGCAVQMGGDDQWGNIVAGIDLIRRLEGKQAYGVTFPLLETASGQKMGKTAAGAIWLDEKKTSVHDFFQYFRNTDDRDVERFLKFFTDLPLDEIESLCSCEGAELNRAKERLAYEACRMVHGEQKARKALEGARAAFYGSGDDEAIPRAVVTGERLAEGLLVIDLLVESGLCRSKSEARRLVQQGGVRLGDSRVETIEKRLERGD
ncbi:MAG: tyrosine--tRNA ligase, partial [Deltaproteobacteria bacterium]